MLSVILGYSSRFRNGCRPLCDAAAEQQVFQGNMVLQRNVRVAADSWSLDVHFQGLLMRIRQDAMRLAKTHQPHRSD